jgi:hypothetical protein
MTRSRLAASSFAGGLVSQDEAAARHQAPGHRDPLLLAAGELLE